MGTIIRKTAEQAFAIGKMQFPTTVLPKGYRIDDAFLVLRGALNVPAAGVTSDQLTRLVLLAECERRYRTDGIGINALDWVKEGRDLSRPANIAVGAAQAVELFWPLSIGHDPRGVETKDNAPATDFYLGRFFDVHWKDPAVILAALAVNAGTMAFIEFHLSPLPAGTVPTSQVVNFVEFNGAETILPGGLDYLEVVVVKPDGAAITDAEMGNMRLVRDAVEDIVESNTRLSSLVRAFNRFAAAGAQVQGATDGVEGEALDPAAVPFVPVLTPGPLPYKGTKLPRVVEKLVLTRDGTLAAGGGVRVYYRANEVRDQATVLRAGAKLGWRGAVVQAKTSSKNGVSAARGFLSGIAARITGR